MSLEQKLTGWAGPSSDSEQERQERTERMVRQAIAEHAPLRNCDLSVYAKGSYANNTNVREDSDVDIAVECTEAEYWDEEVKGAHPPGKPYSGIWTPAKLRNELVAALKQKFGTGIDASGSTAIRVHSNTARVDADVVPCFSYRYYFEAGSSREGTKIFKKDGASLVNYPQQQLENGRSKNVRTNLAYKKAVRILKRVENAMAEARIIKGLPSYFVECLVYNCPDALLSDSTWTGTMRAILSHIWKSLEGEEPDESSQRWVEANDCFYLFHGAQKWSRSDARSFSAEAWDYLDLTRI